jgi:LysM repeat protein
MRLAKPTLLLALLLWPLFAFAQGEIQTYVIKKGDTLWGISQKFLKDPYYWPSLWSNNPDLTNPHLIYPGQEITIYDGRVQLVPVAETAAETTAPETRPEPAEATTITIQRAGRGFISEDEFNAAGTLVDTTDNRLLIASGETVFLDIKNLESVQPGDLYSLFDVGDPVTHPLTGRKVGYLVEDIGTVRIVDINEEVATGEIDKAYQEIERGARLRPYQPAQASIDLKRATSALTGTLIEAHDSKLAISQYDIVYLDLGSDDGLQVGNLLNITRPRDASALGLNTSGLKLPDVLLGAAVVIETHPRAASALVLKIAEPLYRGDRMSTVLE